MASTQEKITVYNLADLKNTSDDAIPNYLNSLKFSQSHRLTDVRLALGYAAFVVAGACFLWDYKLGFESTKYYTAAAVALYTLLNGALTLWIFYVEKGAVYEGTAPDADRTTIRITTATPSATEELRNTVLTRPFTEWFDGAGHFVAAPFQAMLASSIPVVGRLDPKRVAAAATETSSFESKYSAEILQALENAESAAEVISTATSVDAAATTTGTPAKKGGKRRKA
ncbi:microsomal signal peptidase 25 kDa subunit-domain-containing protein [Bombardia bombarda]|uniref:Signal peptidase complex subunit 2 n=1 Tax=Bombardia bombarda TaxID=252184 RepID=A0AA39X7C9_9PEZI|nr:microsomal signal peptidase 25 kDa subunit-domain-containing protein [Bombardia bombarda]